MLLITITIEKPMAACESTPHSDPVHDHDDDLTGLILLMTMITTTITITMAACKSISYSDPVHDHDVDLPRWLHRHLLPA